MITQGDVIYNKTTDSVLLIYDVIDNFRYTVIDNCGREFAYTPCLKEYVITKHSKDYDMLLSKFKEDKIKAKLEVNFYKVDCFLDTL